MFTYDEMKKKTIEFYKSLGVSVPKKYLKRAVSSLTMPQFAKQYNDVNLEKINDHRALATVGDEFVGAFYMQNKYKYNSSMGELTKAKKALKNINLNSIGQKLCGEHLFATNNDLNEKNNKSYATSFEAIIGFISLFDLTSAKRVFDEYMK